VIVYRQQEPNINGILKEKRHQITFLRWHHTAENDLQFKNTYYLIWNIYIR